ncbi:MAG: hypothetical protein IKE64_07410 [Thermoguttaceae bacterium]|nr:hypothetical protein [Thermoguttaceae bacterium]
MKSDKDKFYNSNRPFDGGNAIVEEIRKLRRQIDKAPKNGRRWETLRARERRYLTELCERLAGLIIEAANGCYQKHGRFTGFSYRNDLENDAYVTLLSKVIEKFNPDLGVKFSSFAYDHVDWGCRDKVAQQDHSARKRGKKPKVVFCSHDALAEMGRASYRDLDPGDREILDHIHSLEPCDRDIVSVIAGEMTIAEYTKRWECTRYMAGVHAKAVDDFYHAWWEGVPHLPKNVQWNRFQPRKAAALSDHGIGRGHGGPEVSKKIEGSRDQAA